MADLLGNTLIKCYSEETLCVFDLAQYPCNSVGDQVHDLQPGAEGTCYHSQQPIFADLLASDLVVADLLLTGLPFTLRC